MSVVRAAAGAAALVLSVPLLCAGAPPASAAGPAPSAGAAGTLALMDVSSSGEQADREAYGETVSDDGRYVVFSTASRTLAPHDVNGFFDVYRHDRVSGQTVRVSRGHGKGVHGTSGDADLSADGRYVVFLSQAGELVEPPIGHRRHVYVRDMVTEVTRLVDVTPAGVRAGRAAEPDRPSISDDGRFVAFTSAADDLVPGDVNGVADVFVRDLQQGTTSRVNPADEQMAPSGAADLSGDGRYVAFATTRDDTAAGDTNEWADVYRRDLTTGSVQRVSVTTGGAQGERSSSEPSLSTDGSVVAFLSDSSFGRPGSEVCPQDAFVRDLRTGTTTEVSTLAGDGEGCGAVNSVALAADGTAVTFGYSGTLGADGTVHPGDVFVRDLTPGAAPVPLRTAATGDSSLSSYVRSISGDGRRIALNCFDDLLPTDTRSQRDVYLYTR